jgi:hypothetical protein
MQFIIVLIVILQTSCFVTKLTNHLKFIEVAKGGGQVGGQDGGQVQLGNWTNSSLIPSKNQNKQIQTRTIKNQSERIRTHQ